MLKRFFYLKLLMSLMLVALAVPLAQAETLDVAVGTETNSNMPILGYYYNSLPTNQMIYPENLVEDMQGSSITGVKFYCSNSGGLFFSGGKVTFTIGTTSVSNFSTAAAVTISGTVSTVDFVPTAGMEYIDLTFDTPFEYNGGNIIIQSVVVEKGTEDTYSNRTYFYGISSTGASYSSHSYYGSKAIVDFLPRATFTYEGAQVQDYAAKVTPESLAFGALVVDEEKTLNVTLRNNGANPFTPSISLSGDGFSTTYVASEIASKQTVTIPVKFAPTTNGNFTGTLTIDCGHGITPFEIPLTGSAAYSLTLYKDATSTNNSYVPIYGYYYDEKQVNEIIYHASLLEDLVGSKITGLTFYTSGGVKYGTTNPGKYQVSLGTTETEVFTSGARLSDVTLTTVKTGLGAQDGVEGNNLTITFDTPFEYNGGNLVVDFEVVETGNYDATTFYSESKTGASFRSYGNNIGNGSVENYIPKMTIAYDPGDVEPVYTLEVTDPESKAIDFGEINVGQTGTASVTIKNTGNTAVTPKLTFDNEAFTVSSTDNGELAKKASRTYTITFAPTAGETYNGTLTVADMDGLVASPVAVAVTGVGHVLAPYEVNVTPENGTDFNFGEVDVNASKTWTISINNTGANAVTPTISGLESPFSTLYTATELEAGNTANIAIVFRPTEIQPYGPQTITLSFPGSGISDYTFTLNGTGREENTGTKPASFYDGISYTWTPDGSTDEKTSKLSDIATDPDQMIALLKKVYTDKTIPGNWYRGYTADGEHEATNTYGMVSYPPIGKIAQTYTTGEGYSYAYTDAYGWNIGNDAENYPILSATEGSYYNLRYFNPNEYKPDEEGLTLLLVEMNDNTVDDEGNITNDITSAYSSSSTTSDYASLRSMFSTLFKSIRVITHSKKFGVGTNNEGTLFKIDCDKMNRFFFLAKGRLRVNDNSPANPGESWAANGEPNFYWRSSESSGSYNDGLFIAPFYQMFEQFSPVSLSNTAIVSDVYQELVNMKSYDVEHECQSIPFMTVSGSDMLGHEFNMYGKGSQSADCQDVRDLMFFVPEHRMTYYNGRNRSSYDRFVNYHNSYMPSMGLYVIRQNAITGEQTTHNGSDEWYQLHLSWQSNLTSFLPSADGTYFIYQVMDDGSYQLVGTTTSDVTTLDVWVQMQESGQQVTYVIQGQDNSQFLSLQMSNAESFIIPGTNPAEMIQLVPNADNYSRFDPQTEQNFYANGLMVRNNLFAATPALMSGVAMNYYRMAEGENEWTKVATVTINGDATSANVSMVDETQREQSEYKYGFKTNPSSLPISTDDNGYLVFGTTEQPFIIYDNLKASVEGNNHPNYYKYKVDFTTATTFGSDEINEAFSNEMTVRVFKTSMSTISGEFSKDYVDNDVERDTDLGNVTFDIDVDHSSKTEILRYDAYRWNSTYGTDQNPYQIIDHNSAPDNEQDIAPNGEADNQGEYYTIKMDAENQGQVDVPQGGTAQATFTDNVAPQTVDYYTYAPVVETFTNRGDYNTYGAPLQNTAIGKVEVAIDKKVVNKDYKWTIDNKDYYYYLVTLKVNAINLPDGYEVYKVRAWRKIESQYLGEESGKYESRAVLDKNGEYNFEILDKCENGSPLGETTDANNVYSGNFGAIALSNGDEIPMEFVVRVYFTKPAANTSNAPHIKAIESADGKYYIAETTIQGSLTSSIPTSIFGVISAKEVAGVKYYNIAGVESDHPFQGVNIEVTRYSDGSQSTRKIMK